MICGFGLSFFYHCFKASVFCLDHGYDFFIMSPSCTYHVYASSIYHRLIVCLSSNLCHSLRVSTGLSYHRWSGLLRLTGVLGRLVLSQMTFARGKCTVLLLDCYPQRVHVVIWYILSP